MDHLSTALRKGGVKDLLLFFPINKRDNKTLDEHFRQHELPQVAEWWVKKQYAIAKETIVTLLKESIEREESHEEVSIHPKRKNDDAEWRVYLIDYCWYQSSPGGAQTSRDRADCMHLARPYGDRRLERPPGSD